MPFQIVRNDITKMQVDAVVNTANPEPVYASGTDAAIYKAAGAEKLLEARRKIGALECGTAAVTPAFELNAKYIIHTVGPVWKNGEAGERELLESCYENSLRLALEYKCESIAFPLISTGVYGFPKEEALQIALRVFSQFLMQEEMMIYLVVFDKESFALTNKVFQGVEAYIDENYVAEQKQEQAQYFRYEDYSRRRREWNIPDCVRETNAGMFGSSIRGKSSADEVPDRYREESIERIVEECQVLESPAGESFAEESFAAKPTRSLDDVIAQLGETFQERLLRLIDERGLDDVEVYKKANLSRKLFSKIRCNSNYKPAKKTAISLALALELSLDETKDFLGRAELALSPSSKFDLIIQYFIEQKVYDIYTINLALFQHDQPILGE